MIKTGVLGGMKLPIVMAPMLLISNPRMVVAACRAGIVGTFPSLNQRSTEGYEEWLQEIRDQLRPGDAPFGVNLIVRESNPRLGDDLAATIRHKVPLVITSLGFDAELIARVHDYGGTVFHDVASPRHIEKAVAAGVDGVILLSHGAGGHTGQLNPFALVREARRQYDGAILLAGALSRGEDVAAALMAGADAAYMGTRFIATKEADAPPDYLRMILEGKASDVTVTRAITGTPASFLNASLKAAGLDPSSLVRAVERLVEAPDGRAIKPWKEIWSAGQGVGGIDDVPALAQLVADLEAQFASAAARFRRISGL